VRKCLGGGGGKVFDDNEEASSDVVSGIKSPLVSFAILTDKLYYVSVS